MPMKRGYRRRRPVTRKRRVYKRPNMVSRRRIPRPVGVTKYRDVKLYYTDVNQTTVAISSYATWTYQTSLFDPYYAVGGHQPLFFDQYATMYKNYVVFGIGYNIQFCSDGSTVPIFVTVEPSPDPVTLTTLSSVRERNGVKESIVANGYRTSLRGYISTKKVLGISRQKLLSDDKYSSVTTTSPAVMAYLKIQTWNQSGTATVNLYFSVRLTYYCRFFEPLIVAQS